MSKRIISFRVLPNLRNKVQIISMIMYCKSSTESDICKNSSYSQSELLLRNGGPFPVGVGYSHTLGIYRCAALMGGFLLKVCTYDGCFFGHPSTCHGYHFGNFTSFGLKNGGTYAIVL